MAIASPFLAGDQLLVNGLISEEDLRVGSIDYSLPLGASGLRGRLGYAHTGYELGGNFAALDATGHARVSTLGVSYPVLRSQTVNLSVGALYQHKDLRDEYGALELREDKSSQVLPLSLRFDFRDGWAGGGLSYGSVTWTYGRLDLDPSLRALDRDTLRSHGGFDKLNVDLARVQRLNAPLTLYARLSA